MGNYIFKLIFLLLLFINLNTSLCQIKVDSSTAHNFTLSNLADVQYSLQNLKGEKLTIIMFWATWGLDSIKMLDDLQRLYNKYRTMGLSVIGVCVEQQVLNDTVRQKIIDTVKHKQITFPILLDQQLQTFLLYNVVAVPTVFAIDKELKIIYRLAGYPIVGSDELFNLITESFEGKPATPITKHTRREPDKIALRTFNMAKIEFEKGRTEDAKKHALKALRIDSLFTEPPILLAEIALEANQLPDAANYIEQALAFNPNSTKVLSLRGLLSAMQDSLTKAISELTKIVKQDSSDAIAICYLGYALGMNGDLQRSLHEFERAKALSKNEYRIPLLCSKVYKHFDMQKEALAAMILSKKLRAE